VCVCRTKNKSYACQTVVSNQKSIPVVVAIVESLPLSRNDKIKVSYVVRGALAQPTQSGRGTDSALRQEPLLESLEQVNFTTDVEVGAGLTEEQIARQPTYLNKDTNNIVWVKSLRPKGKVTIPFRYGIEW
jgi:hypothetical protein